MVLRFAGVKRSSFPKALDIAGLQMSDWYFTECVYNQCDEVRVFDQNEHGAQAESGRFLIQFSRHGEVVGEHLADSVDVRKAGSPRIAVDQPGGTVRVIRTVVERPAGH